MSDNLLRFIQLGFGRPLGLVIKHLRTSGIVTKPKTNVSTERFRSLNILVNERNRLITVL